MRHAWNAEKYAALPLPHIEWGKRTVARLDLNGGETVLEAGAGTGRDAELVLARIPNGHFIAVDGSSNMLALLGERLADYGDRVTQIEADLNEPLPIERPVDAIYSVATFHWIDDHDRLFAHLSAALRPGGQLAFDCGGKNNVSEAIEAMATVLGGKRAHYNFRDAEQTHDSLAAAGFTEIDTSLRSSVYQAQSRDEFARYIDAVMIGREAELRGLDADGRAELVSAIADELPAMAVEYVRLEARAVKVANA